MNLREFSSLLGLSQTTVSRALNGFPEVAQETRARVEAAASLHGYRPSAAARRLATGKTGTLGVVFPQERNMLTDLLFTEFLAGCVECAAGHDYDITLSMASGASSEEAVYRRAVRNARVDGMIISSPLLEDPRPGLLQALKMPFVLHGRTLSPASFACLDIDNEGAFAQATRYLCDLGHRHIALLNGEARFNYSVDRARGYVSTLMKAGVPVIPALLSHGPMLEAVGHEAAIRLLNLPDDVRPTAFLCSSVLQARGVTRAVRAAGLVIGRDISVVCHDDRLKELRTEDFDPPLTATQSSIHAAGVRVVDLLVERLNDGNQQAVSEIWPVDLVVRGSTGPCLARR